MSGLLEMQLANMQELADWGRSQRSGAGRPRKPKPTVLPRTDMHPPRAANEPMMALAFRLRLMQGIKWDLATAETAAEFGLPVKRCNGRVTSTRGAESKVERAEKEWRPIVIPFLAEVFPDRAAELLREL